MSRKYLHTLCRRLLNGSQFLVEKLTLGDEGGPWYHGLTMQRLRSQSIRSDLVTKYEVWILRTWDDLILAFRVS